MSQKEKHPASVPALLDSLQHLKETDPKAVRSTTHVYPPSIYVPYGHLAYQPKAESSRAPRDRYITSWKMTEHMYRDANNPFPTLARGLFTEKLEEGDEIPDEVRRLEGDIKQRIVARGYDKFFNVGEVGWTGWDTMEDHTQGPYDVTLKSNGCLILVSALTPHHLLVASKHSLGTTTEDEKPAVASAEQGILASSMQKLDLGGGSVHSASDKGRQRERESKPAAGTTPNGQKGKKQKGKSDASEAKLAEVDKKLADPTVPEEEKIRLRERRNNLVAAQHRRHESESSPAPSEAKEGQNDVEGSAAGSVDGHAAEERQSRAHAEVGRAWLARTLHEHGRKEWELAQKLWDGNMTAVFELCDDSFEEHVIATPSYWTGLHLHGLNHNTPHFSTAPPDQVAALAAEFGFIETKSVQFATLDQVKAFTDDIAKTGTWNGDAIEGFVVRSTVKASPKVGKPPYRPRSPFFFKVKFDEPYLLYRQWREVTRAMLPLLDGSEKEEAVWKKVKPKCRARQEVGVYAEWVGRMIKQEPNIFSHYETGVVSVREKFLRWIEDTEDGRKAWAAAKRGKWEMGKSVNEQEREKLPKKWMLVPIAIPGCGKTMLGVALSQLFNIGHTQSDDITTKRSAPAFLRHIKELFSTHDAVYADRNNHIDKHYDELAELAESMACPDPQPKAKKGAAEQQARQPSNVRMIAIMWKVESEPYQKAVRICSERIVRRGDNHQTLRPDFSAEAEHEAVVSQFLRNFTHPHPQDFDTIIEIPLTASLEEALRLVIDGLADIPGFPLGDGPRPSEEVRHEALAAAQAYKTTTAFHASSQKHGRAPRYFGLAPEIDLAAAVESLVTENESARAIFEAIKAAERITDRPHVTLCHEKTVAQEKESQRADGAGPHEQLWDQCKRLAESKDFVMWDFDITHLVWDDRVMALVIGNLRAGAVIRNGEDTAPESDLQKQLELPDGLEADLHITVGTRAEEISAFEAKALTRAVRPYIAAQDSPPAGGLDEVVEGGGEVHLIKVPALKGQGRIKGMS